MMKIKNPFKNGCVAARFIASALVLTFGFTSVIPPSSFAFTPVAVENSPALLPGVNEFKLPPELGSIVSEFQGSRPDRFVAYIQDAHASADAQRSIQKIIDYFESHFSLGLVAFEGVEGELDPFLFRAFPNREILENVLNGYVRQGELSGIDFAAAVNTHESRYVGIENRNIYESGIALFLEAERNLPAVEHALNRIEDEIAEAQRRSYPPDLKEMAEKIRDFEQERIDLVTLVAYLDQSNTPPPVNSPIEQLIKAMKNTSGGEKEIKELRERFDPFRLWQDVRSWARAIKEKMYRSDLDKNLDLMEENIRFLKDLARLQLTPEEFQSYLADQRAYEPEQIQSFLKSIGQNGGITFDITPAVLFYRNALVRDHILSDRLITLVSEKKNKATAFISGGFHTPGITERLKKEDVSFVVIQPAMNDFNHENRYLDVMQGNISYRNRFERNARGEVNLYQAFAKDATERLARKLSEIGPLASGLRQWRDEVVRRRVARGRATDAHRYTYFIDQLADRLQNKNLKINSESELAHSIEGALQGFSRNYQRIYKEKVLAEFHKVMGKAKELYENQALNFENLNRLFLGSTNSSGIVGNTHPLFDEFIHLEGLPSDDWLKGIPVGSNPPTPQREPVTVPVGFGAVELKLTEADIQEIKEVIRERAGKYTPEAYQYLIPSLEALSKIKEITGWDIKEILITIAKHTSGSTTPTAYQYLPPAIEALSQIKDITSQEIKEILITIVKHAGIGTGNAYKYVPTAVQVLNQIEGITGQEIKELLITIPTFTHSITEGAYGYLPTAVEALSKVKDITHGDIMEILTAIVKRQLGGTFDAFLSLPPAIQALNQIEGITGREIKEILITIAERWGEKTDKGYQAIPANIETLRKKEGITGQEIRQIFASPFFVAILGRIDVFLSLLSTDDSKPFNVELEEALRKIKTNVTSGGKVRYYRSSVRLTPTENEETLAEEFVRIIETHEYPPSDLQLGVGGIQSTRARSIALGLFIATTDHNNFQGIIKAPWTEIGSPKGILIGGITVKEPYPFTETPYARMDYLIPGSKEKFQDKAKLTSLIRFVKNLSYGLYLAEVLQRGRREALSPEEIAIANIYIRYEREFVRILRKYEEYTDETSLAKAGDSDEDYQERLDALKKYKLEESLWPQRKWLVDLNTYSRDDKDWNELVPYLRRVEFTLLDQEPFEDTDTPVAKKFIRDIRNLVFESTQEIQDIKDGRITPDKYIALLEGSDPLIDSEDLISTTLYARKIAEDLRTNKLSPKDVPDLKAIEYYSKENLSGFGIAQVVEKAVPETEEQILTASNPTTPRREPVRVPIPEKVPKRPRPERTPSKPQRLPATPTPQREPVTVPAGFGIVKDWKNELGTTGYVDLGKRQYFQERFEIFTDKETGQLMWKTPTGQTIPIDLSLQKPRLRLRRETELSLDGLLKGDVESSGKFIDALFSNIYSNDNSVRGQSELYETIYSTQEFIRASFRKSPFGNRADTITQMLDGVSTVNEMGEAVAQRHPTLIAIDEAIANAIQALVNHASEEGPDFTGALMIRAYENREKELVVEIVDDGTGILFPLREKLGREEFSWRPEGSPLSRGLGNGLMRHYHDALNTNVSAIEIHTKSREAAAGDGIVGIANRELEESVLLVKRPEDSRPTQTWQKSERRERGTLVRFLINASERSGFGAAEAPPVGFGAEAPFVEHQRLSLTFPGRHEVVHRFVLNRLMNEKTKRIVDFGSGFYFKTLLPVTTQELKQKLVASNRSDIEVIAMDQIDPKYVVFDRKRDEILVFDAQNDLIAHKFGTAEDHLYISEAGEELGRFSAYRVNRARRILLKFRDGKNISERFRVFQDPLSELKKQGITYRRSDGFRIPVELMENDIVLMMNIFENASRERAQRELDQIAESMRQGFLVYGYSSGSSSKPGNRFAFKVDKVEKGRRVPQSLILADPWLLPYMRGRPDLTLLDDASVWWGRNDPTPSLEVMRANGFDIHDLRDQNLGFEIRYQGIGVRVLRAGLFGDQTRGSGFGAELPEFPDERQLGEVLTKPKEPLLKRDPNVFWRSQGFTTPGAFRLDGKVYLIVRGIDEHGVSRLGLAVSTDGYSVEAKGISPAPIFEPHLEKSERGVENARITIIDGKIYMLYTARGGPDVFRIGLASMAVDEFRKSLLEGNWARRWNRHKIELNGRWDINDRNAAIFPEKINGKFAMYFRDLDSKTGTRVLRLALADQPEGPWTAVNSDRFVLTPQILEKHLKEKSSKPIMFVGVGAPPQLTKDGWLTFFHYVDEDHIYRMGFFVSDRENPLKILYVHDRPIWQLSDADYDIVEPNELYAVSRGMALRVIAKRLFQQGRTAGFFSLADAATFRQMRGHKVPAGDRYTIHVSGAVPEFDTDMLKPGDRMLLYGGVFNTRTGLGIFEYPELGDLIARGQGLPEPERTSLSDKKILVIEDTPVVRDAIVKALREIGKVDPKYGGEIVAPASYLELKKILEDAHIGRISFDAAIIDHNIRDFKFPGVETGYQALAYLSALKGYGPRAAIYYTSAQVLNDDSRAKLLGVRWVRKAKSDTKLDWIVSPEKLIRQDLPAMLAAKEHILHQNRIVPRERLAEEARRILGVGIGDIRRTIQGIGDPIPLQAIWQLKYGSELEQTESVTRPFSGGIVLVYAVRPITQNATFQEGERIIFVHENSGVRTGEFKGGEFRFTDRDAFHKLYFGKHVTELVRAAEQIPQAAAGFGAGDESPASLSDLNQVNTIVFDLTGTLLTDGLAKAIETISGVFGVDATIVKHWLKDSEQAVALRLGSLQSDEYWSYVLGSLEDETHKVPAGEEARRFFTLELSEQKAQLRQWFYDAYEEIQGVAQMIQSLEKSGYHISIFTNMSADPAEYLKTKFPWLPSFIITSADVGVTKPNPEGFEKVFELLSRQAGITKPQEILYVDDDLDNLTHPKNLGWRTQRVEKNAPLPESNVMRELLSRSAGFGVSSNFKSALGYGLIYLAVWAWPAVVINEVYWAIPWLYTRHQVHKDPYGHFAAHWGGIEYLDSYWSVHEYLEDAFEALEIHEKTDSDGDFEYYYAKPDEAKEKLNKAKEKVAELDREEAEFDAKEMDWDGADLFQYKPDENKRIADRIAEIERIIPESSSWSGRHITSRAWLIKNDEYGDERKTISGIGDAVQSKSALFYQWVNQSIKDSFEWAKWWFALASGISLAYGLMLRGFFKTGLYEQSAARADRLWDDFKSGVSGLIPGFVGNLGIMSAASGASASVIASIPKRQQSVAGSLTHRMIAEERAVWYPLVSRDRLWVRLRAEELSDRALVVTERYRPGKKGKQEPPRSYVIINVPEKGPQGAKLFTAVIDAHYPDPKFWRFNRSNWFWPNRRRFKSFRMMSAKTAGLSDVVDAENQLMIQARFGDGKIPRRLKNLNAVQFSLLSKELTDGLQKAFLNGERAAEQFAERLSESDRTALYPTAGFGAKDEMDTKRKKKWYDFFSQFRLKNDSPSALLQDSSVKRLPKRFSNFLELVFGQDRKISILDVGTLDGAWGEKLLADSHLRSRISEIVGVDVRLDGVTEGSSVRDGIRVEYKEAEIEKLDEKRKFDLIVMNAPFRLSWEPVWSGSIWRDIYPEYLLKHAKEHAVIILAFRSTAFFGLSGDALRFEIPYPRLAWVNVILNTALVNVILNFLWAFVTTFIEYVLRIMMRMFPIHIIGENISINVAMDEIRKAGFHVRVIKRKFPDYPVGHYSLSPLVIAVRSRQDNQGNGFGAQSSAPEITWGEGIGRTVQDALSEHFRSERYREARQISVERVSQKNQSARMVFFYGRGLKKIATVEGITNDAVLKSKDAVLAEIDEAFDRAALTRRDMVIKIGKATALASVLAAGGSFLAWWYARPSAPERFQAAQKPFADDTFVYYGPHITKKEAEKVLAEVDKILARMPVNPKTGRKQLTFLEEGGRYPDGFMEELVRRKYPHLSKLFRIELLYEHKKEVRDVLEELARETAKAREINPVILDELIERFSKSTDSGAAFAAELLKGLKVRGVRLISSDISVDAWILAAHAGEMQTILSAALALGDLDKYDEFRSMQKELLHREIKARETTRKEFLAELSRREEFSGDAFIMHRGSQHYPFRSLLNPENRDLHVISEMDSANELRSAKLYAKVLGNEPMTQEEDAYEFFFQLFHGTILNSPRFQNIQDLADFENEASEQFKLNGGARAVLEQMAKDLKAERETPKKRTKEVPQFIILRALYHRGMISDYSWQKYFEAGFGATDSNSIVNQMEQTYDVIAPSFRFAEDQTVDLVEHRNTFLALIPTDEQIVDAGTGAGPDAAWFDQQGYKVIGVDQSEGMLNQARTHHPNLDFRKMDLRKLDIPSQSAGGVWDNAAFHHLPLESAAQALDEYRRVLKDDGILSIRVKEGVGEVFVKEKEYEVSRFFKFWQKDELAAFVAKHGFEVIDVDVVPEGPTENGKPARGVNWVVLFAKRLPVQKNILAEASDSKAGFGAGPGYFDRGVLFWEREKILADAIGVLENTPSILRPKVTVRYPGAGKRHQRKPGALIFSKNTDRLIVAGDLHGRGRPNLELILKETNIEEALKDPKTALVILGDAIHPGAAYPDNEYMSKEANMDSLITLLMIADLIRRFPGQVHYFPGNHDFTHVRNLEGERVFNVYKTMYEFDQAAIFEGFLKREFGPDGAQRLIDLLEKFILASPLIGRFGPAAKSKANALAVSIAHAGPSFYPGFARGHPFEINTRRDMINLSHRAFYQHPDSSKRIPGLQKDMITGVLQNLLYGRRYGQLFYRYELDRFNKALAADFMISGHTPPMQDAAKSYGLSIIDEGLIGHFQNKQLIVDSQTDEFAFLDLNLRQRLPDGLEELTGPGRKPTSAFKIRTAAGFGAGGIGTGVETGIGALRWTLDGDITETELEQLHEIFKDRFSSYYLDLTLHTRPGTRKGVIKYGDEVVGGFVLEVKTPPQLSRNKRKRLAYVEGYIAVHRNARQVVSPRVGLLIRDQMLRLLEEDPRDFGKILFKRLTYDGMRLMKTAGAKIISEEEYTPGKNLYTMSLSVSGTIGNGNGRGFGLENLPSAPNVAKLLRLDRAKVREILDQIHTIGFVQTRAMLEGDLLGALQNRQADPGTISILAGEIAGRDHPWTAEELIARLVKEFYLSEYADDPQLLGELTLRVNQLLFMFERFQLGKLSQSSNHYAPSENEKAKITSRIDAMLNENAADFETAVSSMGRTMDLLLASFAGVTDSTAVAYERETVPSKIDELTRLVSGGKIHYFHPPGELGIVKTIQDVIARSRGVSPRGPRGKMPRLRWNVAHNDKLTLLNMLSSIKRHVYYDKGISPADLRQSLPNANGVLVIPTMAKLAGGSTQAFHTQNIIVYGGREFDESQPGLRILAAKVDQLARILGQTNATAREALLRQLEDYGFFIKGAKGGQFIFVDRNAFLAKLEQTFMTQKQTAVAA